MPADDEGEGRREGEAAEEEPADPRRGVVAERVDEGAHRRPAVVGLVGEAAGEDPAQPRGDGAPRRRRVEQALGDRDGDASGALAGEGVDAVDRLPEGDREGEDVAAGVGRQAEPLLGRHVEGRADEVPLLGELAAEDARPGQEGEARVFAGEGEGRGLVGAGEAEVHDPDPTVVADHDVLGLDVAVDQAGSVGGREALTDGEEDLEDRRPRRRVSLEPGVEGEAVDELHRQVDLVLVRADVVDRDDVGVRELGHRLGLALEASAGVGVGRQQELERDLAIELRVVRGVDHPHPALADEVEDDVAADDLAGLERPLEGVVEGGALGRDDGDAGVDRDALRGSIALRILTPSSRPSWPFA